MKYANVFATVDQLALFDGSTDGTIAVQDPSRFPLGAVVRVSNGTTSAEGIAVGYLAPNLLRLVSRASTTNGVLTAGGLPVNLSGFATGSHVSCGPEFVSGTWTGKYETLIPGNTIAVTLQNGDCASPPTLVGGVLYQVTALVDCWIKMNAAATTSDMYIPAKIPHVFAAGHLGESPVLHIAAGGASTAFVTPLIPALNETV